MFCPHSKELFPDFLRQPRNLFGLNSLFSLQIDISRRGIQARHPDNTSRSAPLVDSEHVGKPAATEGDPGGVRRSRGEGSEGRRDRLEVYRGRHLKSAPIANFAVRDSSQVEVSAGKMSYSRSVTLLLLLAILARGKSTTTATTNHHNPREMVTFTSPTRDPIRIVRASPPRNALLLFLCEDCLSAGVNTFFSMDSWQVAISPSSPRGFHRQDTIC